MIQPRLTLGLFGSKRSVAAMLRNVSADSMHFHEFIHVTEERYLRGRVFDGYILMGESSKEARELMTSPEAALRLRDK